MPWDYAVSVPQTARLMGDPAAGIGVTTAQRLAARQKLGSLVTQLEREGTIELRRGMYAGEGWRQMLGDLTVATGREVGIARVDGVRVLRIGDVDAINFADASRVIAHTHPSGNLHFSGGDIFAGFRVYQPGQMSSVLVGPTGAAVRRPTLFRMPLDVLNPDFVPRAQP